MSIALEDSPPHSRITVTVADVLAAVARGLKVLP